MSLTVIKYPCLEKVDYEHRNNMSDIGHDLLRLPTNGLSLAIEERSSPLPVLKKKLAQRLLAWRLSEDRI